MKITLRTQYYANDQRRALWWAMNGASLHSGNPRNCPMATRDECRNHLENVGHSCDDDYNYEWSQAVERFEANS